MRGRLVTQGRYMLVAALAAAALCAVPASASAANEAPDIPWTDYLPAGPSPANVQPPKKLPGCGKATLACIDYEIKRMDQIRRKFGCDHRAVFATTYELLTKVLRETLVKDRKFFQDLKWLIAEDAIFAHMYFRSIDRYNRHHSIPEAWQIAFDTAKSGDQNALQDMLLGINAHVQRDMPFMMAAVGLRTRKGESRKPDHDRMNTVLHDAYNRVVGAIGVRFDSFVTVFTPTWSPIDDMAGQQLVRTWRENVWRNTEKLLNAKTKAERAKVAAGIESDAAGWARMMAAPNTPPGYRATRDAYCKAHNKGKL